MRDSDSKVDAGITTPNKVWGNKRGLAVDCALTRFQEELCAMRLSHGDVHAQQNVMVLAAVLDWVRRYGHGNVTLSSFNHILALKFRCDTVVSVAGTTEIGA